MFVSYRRRRAEMEENMEKNIDFKGCRIIQSNYKIKKVEKDLEKNKDSELRINAKLGVGDVDTVTNLNCVVTVEVDSIQDQDIKEVTVSCEGFFDVYGFNKGHDVKEVIEMARTVAVSTMYPYIRTYISNLTGLDDFNEAITLPIINVAEME